MTIVVIGGGYWGRSDESLPEAKRNFTAQGGRLSRGYAVVTFPEGTEFKGVDSMGAVHWIGEEPEIREVPARKNS